MASCQNSEGQMPHLEQRAFPFQRVHVAVRHITGPPWILLMELWLLKSGEGVLKAVVSIHPCQAKETPTLNHK